MERLRAREVARAVVGVRGAARIRSVHRGGVEVLPGVALAEMVGRLVPRRRPVDVVAATEGATSTGSA